MSSALDPLPPCDGCRNGEPLAFDFTMAFQPIVDLRDRSVFAYEALVRGRDGSGAASILAQVHAGNRYSFDQACRVRAVEMAAALDLPCRLSINFLPNAVYEPAACIRATLAAARRFSFPLERLIFEVTENERALDQQHLKNILQAYRRQGFMTAIDDFGAGYSGLSLLAEFQPDIVKLDMGLVRGVDHDPVRQLIVRSALDLCSALSIQVIGEGVETQAEVDQLEAMGVHLFQGFVFARPGFESLPAVNWPASA